MTERFVVTGEHLDCHRWALKELSRPPYQPTEPAMPANPDKTGSHRARQAALATLNSLGFGAFCVGAATYFSVLNWRNSSFTSTIAVIAAFIVFNLFYLSMAARRNEQHMRHLIALNAALLANTPLQPKTTAAPRTDKTP